MLNGACCAVLRWHLCCHLCSRRLRLQDCDWRTCLCCLLLLQSKGLLLHDCIPSRVLLRNLLLLQLLQLL